jgi:predicted AAA+ superfamily ATPase
MPKWKSFLKGIYDTRPSGMMILVTGSARLYTFKQAGDSMAGRFFAHRLMPLSLIELTEEDRNEENLQKLITRGGFPEAFLAESDEDADRWRLQYTDGLIRNDILDFENIQALNKIARLLELLRYRVGSPISYSSLAQELELSPTTVKKYIEILESLFIIFRVTPFSKNIARALLREPKIYFFDTGLVKGDDGIKFENFCAISLLKQCYLKEDLTGIRMALHYIRTKEGHEVDFCITEDNTLSELIEVKLSEKEIAKNLYYFTSRFKVKGTQLLRYCQTPYQKENIRVLDALRFFNESH